MRIGCVDFVSNTFFPAIAAEELGFFSAEGIEAHVHLLRTVAAFPALRDGQVDVLAAPAHSVLRAFPQWKGAKLVIALAQGTPWVVVLGSNVPGERGDASALKGLRIAVAPGPGPVFRQFLIEFGLEPDRDVQIKAIVRRYRDIYNSGNLDALGEVLAADFVGHNMLPGLPPGLEGARALQQGMLATWPDLHVTTDDLIARGPAQVASIVRAIVKVQKALRANPARAADVGKRRFPSDAAERIASLVERDLPFYDPRISEESVAGVNRLAQSLGLLAAPVSYGQMVAETFRDLWTF